MVHLSKREESKIALLYIGVRILIECPFHAAQTYTEHGVLANFLVHFVLLIKVQCSTGEL